MPALVSCPALDAPLNPAQRIARVAAKYELNRRAQARTSLAEFYRICEPDYILGDWIADLIGHLEWAERTPDAKLMVFAPPRHGKSQTVSRILPAWLLGRHPRQEIMLTASTQDLADEFGRYVRGKINDPVIHEIFPQLDINPSANAVDKIVLQSGGGVRAVGVGGQIVGRGADWLIIDDPYKNRAQAYSASEREKLFNWYRTDARTRLAPNGRIVLMHQRWHIDDLASKLRALAESDSMADQWRVVVYPALCEHPEDDPLFRLKDEPLDPVRWPISRLYPLRANANEMEWLALYQQRPVKEEGGFFKAADVQYHNGMPMKSNVYIGWDGAASLSTTANKSALMPIGFNAQGDSYLGNDYVLAKIDSLEACDKVLDLVVKYRKDGHVVMGICVEKGMFNSVIKPIFNMRCRERNVYASTIEISRAVGKHIIAAPLQARMQQKKVFFPDNKQTRSELIPQFLNFIADADNDEDDGIDGMANVYMAIDHLAIPMPAPEVPELTDQQLEDAKWKRIQNTGVPNRNDKPWGRLNGDEIKQRKS